ncbi:hypothetical protein DFJ73DRAFT_93656 [Zopfochytrium polystomum]|nr:hypothetical protein DFJ73DRAFT_93656 [Zopfochytrium polystomum]
MSTINKTPSQSYNHLVALDISAISSQKFLYASAVPDTTSACNCAVGSTLKSPLDFTIYSASGLLALTVTDPEAGSGWINDNAGEIGAPCVGSVQPGRWNSYPTFPIFSNRYRFCVDQGDPAKFDFAYPYGHDEVAVVNAQDMSFYNSHLKMYDMYFTVALVTRAKRNVQQVLVEFTVSDFSSSNVIPAQMIQTFGNGEFAYYFMTWRYGYLGFSGVPETQIRAFAVEKSGKRVADPNNDYWLIDHATQKAPLHLLSQTAYLDSARKVHITGSVRNLGFSQRYDFNKGTIKLNYTYDDWKTSKRTNLIVDLPSKTWSYDFVVGSLDGNILDRFKSVIEYYASNGNTYTLPGVSSGLQPRLHISNDDGQVDAGVPLDGEYRLEYNVDTIITLPLGNAVVTVDGNPADPYIIDLKTKDYAVGKNHTIQLVQEIFGAGSITLTRGFTVVDGIRGRTDRNFKPARGFLKDVDVLDGWLLGMFTGAIAVYDFNGGSDIKYTINRPDGVISFALVRADPSTKRIYAMDSDTNLHRWNESFALDPNWSIPAYTATDFLVVNETMWLLFGTTVQVLETLTGTEILTINLPKGLTASAITHDTATKKIYIVAQPTDGQTRQNIGSLIPTTLLVASSADPAATPATFTLEYPFSKVVRDAAIVPGKGQIILSYDNGFFVYPLAPPFSVVKRWTDIYNLYGSIMVRPGGDGFSAYSMSYLTVYDFLM